MLKKTTVATPAKRVLGCVLAAILLVVAPYIGLALAMHTYGIYSEPDTGKISVNGVALSDDLYRGFYGSDDVVCAFKSGVTVAARVFPRFSDDNSSVLIIHENGDLFSFGDLRFRKLGVPTDPPNAGTYTYPALPARMVGADVNAALPGAFPSQAELVAWVKAIRASHTEIQWEETELSVVRAGPFGRPFRETVLVYVAQGATWTLAYANLSGVALTGAEYGDRRVSVDDANHLVMESKGGVHATIPFEEGLQAIRAVADR